MPAENQTEQNRIDIVGMKKDIDILGKISEKLDQTLDKLEDIIGTVSTAIKLHDQKFEYQERADTRLGEQITGLETKILAEITKLNLPIPTSKHSRYGNGNSSWWDMQIKDLKPIRWMIFGSIATLLWLVSHLDMVKVFEFFQNQSTVASHTVGGHIPTIISPDHHNS